MSTVEIKGVGAVEFPEGMTPEQIQQAIETDILEAPEPTQTAPLTRSEQTFAQLEQQDSALSRGMKGFGLGLQNFAAGTQQLTTKLNLGSTAEPFVPGFPKPPRLTEAQQSEIGASLQQDIAARDKEIEGLGTAGFVGSLVGEVAPTVALPGGLQGSIAKRIGSGVVADVAASVADPVREGQTRGGNLATAAAFSGGIRTLGSAFGRAFNKISNARAGKVRSKEIQEILDSADAQGISVFFDDVAGSTLAQKASVAAEIFGQFGTGSGRARQNIEALEAANRFLKKLSGDSDDFEETIAEGLRNKLQMFKRAATKKYDRALSAIGDAGEVPIPAFDAAVDRLLKAEIAQGTLARPGLVEILQKFKDAPRGDFSAMIQFRSDLGENVSAFLGSDASVGKKGQRVLQAAKEALDKDMQKFAGQHGGLKEWQDANLFYRNTVVQFKRGKLKALVNQDSAANFDESAAWRYLLAQSGNRTRARKLYQSMDAKGRAAVRFGLIKDALDKSVVEGKPFSPAKFAGSLERNIDVAEQFFRLESKAEMQGLAKVMRHIERAGQFAENPPTGNRLIPLLFPIGAIASPQIAGVAFASSLGLKGLFQTKAGRNFLLAANRAAPGSKAMENIIEGLTRFVARSSNQLSSEVEQ